jgi:uncharacterized membrane protein
MADFDQNGEIIRSTRDVGLDGSRAWCHIMYGLHALSAFGGLIGAATIVGSFLFGWPSIIAVIINYVTRSNVRGSWLDTHWRWQLRTFWLAAAWGLVALVLVFTIIGIPFAWLLLAVLGLWLLYRVIRGWAALISRNPMPVPAD